jgi:hypothetical protein
LRNLALFSHEELHVCAFSNLLFLCLEDRLETYEEPLKSA